MLVNVVLYLLPLGSLSRGGYTRAVISAIVIYVLGLYTRHGIPQFNMTYAGKVFQDAVVMRLFMAGLLLASKPYIIAIAALSLYEITHITTSLFNVSKNH